MHGGARRVLLDSLMWHRMDAWIWRQSDTRLENAAAFLLRHCEVTRESTNTVYLRCRQASCMHP
jgi:hypothetical protein